jgi:hypothetical protein
VKHVLVLVAVAAAADARAQNASDLPTTQTQPAPPPGTGGGFFYPGAPLPQMQPREPREAAPPPGTGAAAAAEEKRGYIINDDSPIFSSDAPEEASPNRTYTVQRGDTLWSISGRYLHGNYEWPRLWSYNPFITNPHWIYPSEVLRLAPPSSEPAPSAPEPAKPAPAPSAPAQSNGVFLRQTGFIEASELANAAKIVASREEKTLLATLDEAYVEYQPQSPLQLGERYTIYKKLKEVKHPETKQSLGWIVQIFGDVDVRGITPSTHIARALITDSINPIERGFLVGPLKRQFKVVEPRTNHLETTGIVVATLRPIELVASEELVFIDKGRRDGVEIGNRFQLVRRGDGYPPLLGAAARDDQRFPHEIFADILVIDLYEGMATGWVAGSSKETQVGDHVIAKRNY